MNHLAVMVVALCERKLDTPVFGKHPEYRNEHTDNI
jgi:hypothetical protein